MKFEALKELDDDLGSLSQRYSCIREDVEMLKKVLAIHPGERPPLSSALDFPGIKTPVVKVKGVACRNIKGNGIYSGFRVVYAYYPDRNTILLVEIFHVREKAAEDTKRLLKYVS